MANKINVNGIELTIEQTFPYVAKTESIVEETVVEVKERPTKKGKKAKEEVVEDEPIVEETTDEVVDESKDEE